jgi:hypothetical protein
VPAVCLFFLEHVHGAVTRVQPEDSAFVHRGEGHSFAALALWADPDGQAPATGWVRDFFAAMQPHLRSGVYSNYLADEGDARVRAAYGSAYDRLVGLKRRWDPSNLFRLNQNVEP